MDCPVESAHNRLNEAHTFWHQALDNYQKPEDFRIAINAMIQGLRNTTFQLQSAKATIPDFEAWYEQKTRRGLAQDARLKWLVEARNIIVKQGDLETYSTATVNILTWLELLLYKFTLDPFTPTEEIVSFAFLYLVKIPENEQKDCILEVERRWVVKDFPDIELLELLAHCYNRLQIVVAEAHVKCGVNFHLCQKYLKHDSGYEAPNCMSATRDDRSARVDPKDGRIIYSAWKHLDLDEQILIKAGERYPIVFLPGKTDFSDAISSMDFLLAQAKNVLLTDGHHITMAFLFGNSGMQKIIPFEVRDQAEKLIAIRAVASEIGKLGSTGVVIIAEAWVAPYEVSNGVEIPARDSNKRKEVLVLYGATEDGRIKNITLPFSKNQNDDIIFEETVSIDEIELNILTPILNIWRNKGH